MFGKLLKHEWRAMVKPMGLASIIVLVTCLAFCLMVSSVSQNPISAIASGNIFRSILTVSTVVMLVVYMIAPSWLLAHRFYKHHFTDEGYLTFTLPATTHQHLLASIVSYLIWGAICSIVLAMCLGLVVYPVIHFNADIGVELEELRLILESASLDVGLAIGNALILPLYSTILLLVAVTLTCTLFPHHKFIYVVGVQYVMNLLLDEILNLFTLISADVSVAWVPLVMRLVLAVGGYFLMHYLIDKRLNI